MTDTSGWPSAGTATDSPYPQARAPRPTGWPHRSRTDRKVAGVAGGLGRALGIDPLLLRVAFVVLTIFGGFGGLLYVIGWLLLPDDGEEYSAIQALLGRGRASMPRPLAVALVVVAAISVASMFSWGLPFWPVVVVGVVLLVTLGRRGHGPQYMAHRRAEHWQRHQTRWEEQAERQAQRWADRTQRWERKADVWGDKAERWINGQGWGSGCGRTRSDAGSSGPFGRPAFWDRPDASTRVAGAAPTATPTDTPPVTLTKDAPVADDPMAPRTPPAWDPLGVAPFAWDLPEPTPLPAQPPARVRRGGAVLTRATLTTALLGAGVAAGLTLAGVWTLTWAQVALVPLGIVVLGLLISMTAGRGLRLAGPAVLLGLLTLALTVTGLRGTSGYGNASWTPTAATLQSDYQLMAGSGTLDLTDVVVPQGQTMTTELTVRAGRATVLLPTGAAVAVNCQVNAGRADCLDQTVSGVHSQAEQHEPGASADTGTLQVTVTVDGGLARVQR